MCGTFLMYIEIKNAIIFNLKNNTFNFLFIRFFFEIKFKNLNKIVFYFFQHQLLEKIIQFHNIEN